METSAGSNRIKTSAEVLWRCVAFLQECARAHRILDNVDALSSTTDFATAGCDVDGPQNVNAAYKAERGQADAAGRTHLSSKAYATPRKWRIEAWWRLARRRGSRQAGRQGPVEVG